MAASTTYSSAPDAKHLLDMIGKDVYDQVKKEAKERSKGELTGQLSFASILGERAYTTDPCQLIKEKRENLIGDRGERHPCGNGSGKGEDVNRFSKERVDEYDNKKMKCSYGSNGKSEGACAPFRRLHVCDKNIQQIKTENITTHNLLLDVCLAAKYEGESLKGYHEQYEVQYPSSGSTMCTELARSFADIGDIVRGRDLYGGSKKEKEKRKQLDDKLKKIFENIKKENNEKLKSLTDDQIREYWWTANRETVWKAITCDEENKLGGYLYFRGTCGDNEKSVTQARDKCRCKKKDNTPDDQVPTYFDYVPQYLRWFEEWGEDFCRKKKKKVENAKKKCRGENNDKYCSRNGCDCEKTVRAKGKLRYGNRCTDCLYACYPYVHWIDKKKEEFDKQVKKYDEEIKKYTKVASGSSRKTRAATIKYEGYEKKFYEKLKESDYGKVDKFLEKLSKDKECEKVDDEEGGKINFAEKHDNNNNDEKEGTFYRSKYCQPCPYCGMKKKVPGKEWEKKNDNCTSGKLYEPKGDAEGTPIKILKSGENHDDIKQKIDDFCKTEDDESLYAAWKCYKHDEVQKVKREGEEEDDDEEDYKNVKAAGGLCILENQKKKEEGKEKKSEKEPEQFQKTFNDFFTYWVAHMLKDSIYWRTKKIKKCLENGKTMKCRNGCNNDCDCFESWVKQKKEKEWKPIKDHFGKQEDIKQETGMDPGDFLEYYLKLQFFEEVSEEKSQTGDEDANEKKRIKEMFDKKNQRTDKVASNEETIIDFMLEEELKDATKCKQDCEQRKPPGAGGGDVRSDTVPSRDPLTPGPTDGHEDSEDEEEEEEEEDEEHGPDDKEGTEENVEETETVEDQVEEEKAKDNTDGKGEEEEDNQGETTQITTQDGVNPCDIVDKLFKDDNTLTNACPTKYEKGREKFPNWKCIPSGDKTDTRERAGRSRRDTSGENTTTGSSGDTNGSVCVPSRRRKLYIQKLHDWAEKQVGTTQVDGKAAQGDAASKDPKVELRNAFIQSAAVETFFLWHKYKAENTKTQGGVGSLPLQTIDRNSANGDDEDNPEKQLKEGTIPHGFLRQMFYTLGDYRDILVGKYVDNGKDMEEVKSNIDSFFSNGEKPDDKKGVEQRKEWWKENAKHIWHGMICALTYDTNTAKDDEGGGPRGQTSSPSSGEKTTLNNPKLSDFVLRPPYFRYLEEWGQNFCKERKKRLEKIEEECMEYGSRGKQKQKYSGDGEECEKVLVEDANIFSDLSSSCATPCRKYRKWIERKKYEFTEQYNAYGGQKNNYVNEQKDKCQTQSNNHDNGFCGTLEKDAAAFLNRLKNGPCKNNNDNGEEHKIDFNDTKKTFKHTEYCGPCSEFKVKCKNGACGDSNTQKKCNGITPIDGNEIAKMITSTEEVVMRVSDNSGNRFDGDLKEACNGKGIFKSIKENKWECRNVCGYVVCKPKEGNRETASGENKDQIITIRALVTHWVQNFLDDYKKIKHKISQCTKTDQGSTCQNKCQNKCKCVGEWIPKKREEWEKIRKRFLEQYKIENDEDFNVRSCLENFLVQIGAANAKNKVIKLSKFGNSCGCSADASAQKNDGHKDAIDCLLQKLQNKIDDCNKNQAQNSVETQPSDENPAQCQDTHPDDDLLLEEEQNPKNMRPGFCPEDDTTEQQEEEQDTCTPAGTVKEEEEEKEEKKDKGDEEEESPSGNSAPDPPESPSAGPNHNQHPPAIPTPATPAADPPQADEPFNRDILEKTIPFGVALALGSIAFLFLKKKTKSSVGNLFQILQIPKSDYDIPTLKSKNRYIPYKSGPYKGKTYIYMEGDSDEDKYAFMSDTTDITSSESEYEEMDINDIYVLTTND
ncbi:hypothetical protein PFNF54_02091 [Plasmodium falciparum NF54]|uniref:Erythrocyte membrane protein 1 n=1 Tax=Plasmodium falciparum (isolate NF54) TaxID=5843 RepID=W7JWX3_PLAFO|nr:hypothetical protein PFNF54_02091 [Plasmodium falciparum NF54]